MSSQTSIDLSTYCQMVQEVRTHATTYFNHCCFKVLHGVSACVYQLVTVAANYYLWLYVFFSFFLRRNHRTRESR